MAAVSPALEFRSSPYAPDDDDDVGGPSVHDDNNDTKRLTGTHTNTSLRDLINNTEDAGIVYDTRPKQRTVYTGPLYRHPYILKHKKLVITIFLLLILTVVFFVLGFVMIGLDEGVRSIILFVFGVLVFIPSSYKLAQVCRKVRRGQSYVPAEYEEDDDE